METRHALHDHVVLSAGDVGTALLTDTTGKPALPAGQVGRGKYIALGIAIGSNAGTEDQ